LKEGIKLQHRQTQQGEAVVVDQAQVIVVKQDQTDVVVDATEVAVVVVATNRGEKFLPPSNERLVIGIVT
jgi:hypothetical protein